jgi:hypothetical protein
MRIVSVDPAARAPVTSPLTLGPRVALGVGDCAAAEPWTRTTTMAATSSCPTKTCRRITVRIFDPAASRRNVSRGAT